MTVGLVLGSLDLVNPTGSPFAIETLADDTSWGNPQPIEVAVRRLFDGSVVVHEGDDNREVNLRVRITASDSGALAAGEKALRAELYRRNTLTYTPADGWGEPTVFDVVTSSLAHTMDDLAEVRGQRTWMVRLVCEPFGRGPDLSTYAAQADDYFGTTRQKSYSFTVDGSARTAATLHVSRASALGDTLIYTRPGQQGMIPLRQYRTGGGAVTTDSTRVSGAYDNDISASGSPFEATVPLSVVPSPGTYTAYALVRTETGSRVSDLAASVRTAISGLSTRATALTPNGTAEISTAYSIVQVGQSFQLPTEVVADPGSAEIEISVESLDLTGGVRLDEVWLAERSQGFLTWPDTAAIAGGGAPAAKHVWVEPVSPTLEDARLLRGTEADKSDAFTPTARYSWDDPHVLEPGLNFGFLVTTGGESDLDFAWYDRYHTHRA